MHILPIGGYMEASRGYVDTEGSQGGYFDAERRGLMLVGFFSLHLLDQGLEGSPQIESMRQLVGTALNDREALVVSSVHSEKLPVISDLEERFLEH